MHLCKQRKVYLVVLLSFIGIFMVTIHKEPYEKIIYLVNNTLAERFFREEPCACMERCLTASDDEWFMEVFREDIPPLLSLENSKLSGDIFKWWQRLQSNSQANYSQVIEELFAIIPGEEHYRDSGPHRCRTCAVVGNSGNLIGSHYGPLIDNNDFVMRMNKAPIEGFENDVGFRTTHRIMYPESAVHLDNSTHLVLFPFKILDIQWITSALSTGTIKRTRFKVIDKIQANKDYVMVMHPAFMHYVHNSWLKSKSPKAYPSTGFLALMFALHVCDEVNVFGFGANSKGIWHHYFEKIPKTFRHTGKHRGGAEYSIILKLHQKNKITLYPGW
ncbi:CMP-N-acetylneuraminate-beta-galactosamide-alpha-2,3-sialyltransferase 2-like [Xyrauchen texanus]|uniref:CMP-N-acetylneuraminate-beta-galactosamide- alpha-2,3-sialyltransferase 2-like n=1 Tax=Xyrauchen texanus TaxID=154827 RepID=UPI0022420B7C|nr:CMP-N-acetylneuraminate-beta-galactosamide-alpha-2,3-sialyltransferase 2-like [Xyrauchen texanus]XP_051992559.1 CMP-N-acetylneuraminate-beta-galactosamide-alpha-2,3-sialyltransferase 2-like [Xyrauchen texanus]